MYTKIVRLRLDEEGRTVTKNQIIHNITSTENRINSTKKRIDKKI